MAVYQHEYVSLKAEGADDKYLNKLLEYAKEVQPVTRYRCPKGFTSSPKKFPAEPKSLRRHGLWFVDREGRACAPTKGATLSNKDYLTREVRKLVEKKVDDEKLSECVATVEGKNPSGNKSRSLNASMAKLSGLMQDMQEEQDIFSVGLDAQSAADGGELGGGYNLTEKSMERLRKKFEELPGDKQKKLINDCLQTKEELEAKLEAAEVAQLECLYEKHPVLGEVFETSAADLRSESVLCASMTSGSDCDGSDVCESSSVSSSTRCNPKYLSRLRNDTIGDKKQKKVLYKHLNSIFRKYHAKVTRCTTALTPAEEQKYIDKLVKVYEKYAAGEDDAARLAAGFFAQMKSCSAGYGDAETPELCVKSPVPGSKVYIPKDLAALKEEFQSLKEHQKANADLNAWWSQFYARHQRLNI